MLQTYRQLARAHRHPTKELIDRQIIAIRNRIFDTQPSLAPFATAVLESLASRNRFVLIMRVLFYRKTEKRFDDAVLRSYGIGTFFRVHQKTN
jgi:hypothetical protein